VYHSKILSYKWVRLVLKVRLRCQLIRYFIDTYNGLKSCEAALGPSVSKIQYMVVDFYAHYIRETSFYFNVKSLRSFKALKTLYLVLDPAYISWKPDIVVFNERLEGPVDRDITITPPQLEEIIKQRLEKFKEALGKHWKLPSIKIVCAGVEVLTGSGWCLPLRPDPGRLA
jgi:hypothetical protein